MHWNHRVIRQEYDYKGVDGERKTDITHAIVEAYYDPEVSNSETVPTSWCEATALSDDGVIGLRLQLELMMKALEKPVVVVKNGTIMGEEA